MTVVQMRKGEVMVKYTNNVNSIPRFAPCIQGFSGRSAGDGGRSAGGEGGKFKGDGGRCTGDKGGRSVGDEGEGTMSGEPNCD